MNDVSVKLLCQTIRKYASMQGGIEKGARLVELCDFSDSIGFLFESEDVYSNCYWCVDKKTHKPFSFRPNQDIKKFMKRKIMDVEMAGESK